MEPKTLGNSSHDELLVSPFSQLPVLRSLLVRNWAKESLSPTGLSAAQDTRWCQSGAYTRSFPPALLTLGRSQGNGI